MSERIENLEGRVRLAVKVVLASLVIGAFGTVALSVVSMTNGDLVTPVFMIVLLLVFWHAARRMAQFSKVWATLLGVVSVIDPILASNPIIMIIKLAVAYVVVRGCYAVYQRESELTEEEAKAESEEPKKRSILKTLGVVVAAGLALGTGSMATFGNNPPGVYTDYDLPNDFRSEIVAEGLVDHNEAILKMYCYDGRARNEYVFFTDTKLVFHGSDFNDGAEAVALADIEYYELGSLDDGELTGLYILTAGGSQYVMTIPTEDGHDRFFFEGLCERIDQTTGEMTAAPANM